MLRAICLRESWMRETRTSGLTRERAPTGPSLLYRILIVSQSDSSSTSLHASGIKCFQAKAGVFAYA